MDTDRSSGEPGELAALRHLKSQMAELRSGTLWVSRLVGLNPRLGNGHKR